MKPMRCRGLLLCCAIASWGCGSGSPSTKGILGSYAVMITAGSKVDADVMTVTQGSNGSLLLTFEFGITTDSGAVNENGLRAALGSGDKVTLAAQPAHVDQSSGYVAGSISGSGTLKASGDCALTLQFTPASGAAMALAVSGTTRL